ncbi:DNA topoisomerase 2-beta [Dermatophagoides farinae]|uniref:DNA topoisomerase (ATP-hydrolyzing) n=1 Tax=Dermatophagoides farinae TaxID=6954 RepID=A0A922IBK6_DERFA|nr:DNA topoisomerase 2-beta [Dermatophagoides farinae]
MANVDIKCLVEILGLKYNIEYTTDEHMKSLRYGRLMIMTDQDPDGTHITGLIINFIHYYWPTLINPLMPIILYRIDELLANELKSMYESKVTTVLIVLTWDGLVTGYFRKAWG